MKPETALFLQKAQDFLSKADELLKRNLWPEEAGRAAYLAGFGIMEHPPQAASAPRGYLYTSRFGE